MTIQDNPYPSVTRIVSVQTVRTCAVCGRVTPALYWVGGFEGGRCWLCLLELGRQLAQDAAEHTYDTTHNDSRGGY